MDALPVLKRLTSGNTVDHISDQLIEFLDWLLIHNNKFTLHSKPLATVGHIVVVCLYLFIYSFNFFCIVFRDRESYSGLHSCYSTTCYI